MEEACEVFKKEFLAIMNEYFDSFAEAMKRLESDLNAASELHVVSEEVSSASIDKIENEIRFMEEKNGEEKNSEFVQSNLKTESNYILNKEEFMDNDFDEEAIFSESNIEICNQAIDVNIAEKSILHIKYYKSTVSTSVLCRFFSFKRI